MSHSVIPLANPLPGRCLLPLPCFRALLLRLLLLTLLASAGAVLAAPAPYRVDPNTLVLFHFDELAGRSTATNSGTLGDNAYSVNMSSDSTTPPVVTGVLGVAGYVGFGNAANLNTSGYLIGFDANDSGTYDGEGAESIPQTLLNMGNGGQTTWTLEAMICPSVTNVNQEIISTDSSTSNRGFQFRLNTAGQLELNFITGGPDLKTAIPATGAHAFVPNAWYHVAATYNGAQVILYWTRVTSSTAAANPISTNAAAVGSTFGAAQGPLVIGNENRAAAGEYFRGLIDEVRISNIARAATNMLRSIDTPTIFDLSLSPTNRPVYAGTMVTLSATATGAEPLAYAWRTDGASGRALTPVPGATTNLYSIDTSGLEPSAYRFDLVVTNSFGAVTSSVVTLNLAAASGPILAADTAIQPSLAMAGNSVLLSASFTGSEPIAYQWFFTPTNGDEPVQIPGATNATWSIPSVQFNNQGAYTLVASNSPLGLGSRSMASTPAILTVIGTPDARFGMTCELLTHPEQTVITARRPRFGWSYQPSGRNDAQAGFQLIVASSYPLALAGIGDMWDSGLVLGSNSLNVVYSGAPLRPATNYFWRVRTMDSHGQLGPFSPAQPFYTDTQLSDPLTSAGLIYQASTNLWANRYPLRYVQAAPVLIANTGPGRWFIDFGQDAFGYATVRVNGNFDGATVQARFGEKASGQAVNTSPGATVRYGTASFTLQNGDVVYPVRPPDISGTTIDPPAAYGVVMPFRYLELINFPGTLSATNVTQQRLVSEFDTNAAAFSSSSPALDRVWDLCRDSMQWLTFDGIYVDGDRERKPYEADAYIQQLSSYGVDREFTIARYTFEYLTTHPTWPTEWSFHMVFIAWADYLQTGNSDLLVKYYDILKARCFLNRARADGLILGNPPGYTDIIDWPSGERDGYVMGNYSTVINAFYYRCLRIMTQVAQLTGHPADAADFAARADQVYASFNTVFWVPATQRYVDGEGATHSAAHANFFPLAFGLVPATNQAAVLSFLHTRAMAPSVYGAQYLLEGLYEAGDADYAFGLLTTNGQRGWLNMLNLGSTLTLEAWDPAYKSNLDWNHAWGAAPGNIIPRYILGLRPLEAGFGRVQIQPQLGQKLASVQGIIPTIRGPVSIQVTNGANSYQMLVNLPGNVTANVLLPVQGMPNAVALLDGEVVPGVVSNGWLTLPNIGAGQHAIWLSPTPAPAPSVLYGNWAASWFGTASDVAALADASADPDGDGSTNYAEFMTGTDPTDPGSRFLLNPLVPTGSPPRVELNFAGRAGRSYALQRSLGLESSDWTTIATSGTLSLNQNVFMADPQPPSTRAFYRVSVTMP